MHRDSTEDKMRVRFAQNRTIEAHLTDSHVVLAVMEERLHRLIEEDGT